MGKRNTIRKSAALVDSDDEGSVSSSSTAMSELTLAPETEEVYGGDKVLEQSLDDLFEKRGSTREKALSSLIDGFSNKLQHHFVENKCITLLNQSHNSFKKGSAKEIILASRVIGLLAMTVGCGDRAHEILEESIPPFSQAMKSGSDSLKIAAILDCLAVITFVGGSVAEDTERSLQIMWQFVYPKLGQNVIASKPNTATLTAAIIAWTFLLTIKDECKLTSKPWQETISYFSNLLEKEDRSLRIAAGEALAVIFEVGNLGKIFNESKGSTDEGFTHLQGLKGKVQNQVRMLSAEAGGRGLTKKDLTSQRDLFSDILEFLEDGYSPESTMKIGPDVLTVSTWRHLIQLNFLKRFLGGGFVKHMQENVLLHEIFDFTPKKKIFGDVHLSGVDKRMYKSPNSVLNKARTQSLNKKRVMAQGRNTGHFALGGDEDA